MRILLDECIDWRFAREIAEHEVQTARQMGWTSIRNGELLALASGQFDVFITADQNLCFQQKLTDRSLAVIVLRPKRNRIAELRKLIAPLIEALNSPKAGAVVVIE